MKTSEIGSLEPGMYAGTNEDGKRVVVMRAKRGGGWSVSTPTHGKWYEVVYYDESGNVEGVSYEC